jgi:DNA-binding transcriptional MerR regulator
MKAGQLAKWLNIGRSTITSWTTGDYQDFFSPGARGGSGQDRHFTENDVRVMRFIAEARRSNIPIDEIIIALRRMQINDWTGLPPMPDAPPSAEFPVVPAAAADAQIDAERRAFLREIAMLQGRVDQLERQIREEQSARRDEIERLLREREEMRATLASAETELRLWQQGRLRPLDES